LYEKLLLPPARVFHHQFREQSSFPSLRSRGKKKQVDYSASTYGKCSFLLSSSPESLIDAKLIAF
jgi:hypothetical protein